MIPSAGRRWGALAALVAFALTWPGAAVAAEPFRAYLHQFELVDEAGVALAPGAPVRVAFELAPGRRLGGELVRRAGRGATAIGASASRFLLERLDYPVDREAPTRAHSRPSFLVDFDEPAVQAVRAEVVKALGPQPTPGALEAFVERWIEKKSLAKSYDVASQVAKSREGDCTEHAVLLTALVRAFKLPARIVHGLVLVEEGERREAFGHAWVEFYRKKEGWQPLDAALVSWRLPRVYVPFGVVTDEGLGFAAKLLSASDMLFVRRIVLQAAAPRDGGVAAPVP